MTDICAFYFRDFSQTREILKLAKILCSTEKQSKWLEIIQNEDKMHFYPYLQHPFLIFMTKTQTYHWIQLMRE